MSKSIGNVVAPKKVIDQYGAEILRLWVSASDYKDDIRISETILKQLSDAYRRIRNTCRFILGNLSDFELEKHAVAYDEMMDLDKFALHSLQELTERSINAYDSFDFHVIYHSLYNYCSVGLSSFYLDILKDRLYTSNPESVKRRSAQTVMYHIVDTIAKIMAPILPFTSEEIWKFMPAADNRSDSIHLEAFPVFDEKFKNPELAEKWGLILDVRGEVTKVLENARAEKLIGHSLDASVTINASKELYDLLAYYEKDLRSIFIVSELSLIKPEDADTSDNAFIATDISGLSIKVGPAAGEKCQRCWIYDPSVGEHPENESICSRCQTELDSMG